MTDFYLLLTELSNQKTLCLQVYGRPSKGAVGFRKFSKVRKDAHLTQAYTVKS